MSKAQSKHPREIYLDWMLDILVYTVVINLFVQFVDDFYIQSFAVSLTVSVVMKSLLVLIMRFEHKAKSFMENHKNKTINKLTLPVTLLILFLSKFLIIEVIDIVYEETVNFHNFIALMLMIVSMILIRMILEKIYYSLPE